MSTYAKPIFNLKNKLGNWLWHIGAWFLYMTYESFSVALATGSFSKLPFYLLHYAVNILLFYFHANVVLPLATQVRRNIIWKVPLLTIVEIALFLAFKFGTDHLIALLYPEMSRNEIILDEKFIAGGIWRSVYFILLSSGYYYLRYYIKERDNRELLEKRTFEEALKAKENFIELNNAKNAFLRAQINPHFLFNTINFIYSKIHKTDPAAGKALSLLSRLMRFALDSGKETELIPLAGELEQVSLLLELWKIRQEEERTAFITEIQEGIGQVRFIPLAVLTLLENMFKHGNLSMEEHPGILRIEKRNGEIRIETRNLINTGLNDSGYHTGLKNIQQRLLLTYGNKADMVHRISGEYFVVEIRAPLS